MLKQILQFVGGMLAGIAVALILLTLVEFFSAVVYPVPADFPGTMEAMCEHVARYPHWVLAVVVPMWGATAWASTWSAGRVGKRPAAITIGLLLIVGLLFNVTMLPYHLWFKLVIVPVVGAAAWHASRARRTPEAMVRREGTRGE